MSENLNKLGFARFLSLDGGGAIVTGGASGIGAAIVRRLMQNGMRVGLIDRDDDAARALLATFAADAPKPLIALHDLTDLDGIEAVVDDLARRMGGLRLLVNNAARDDRHSIAEITPAYWREQMATNLDHMVFAAKAAHKHLRDAGGGAIVNMGSITWRLGYQGLPAYATAKAAIEGLTNALAREMGPDRIRVSCIVPGFVRTERQVALWLTPELAASIREIQCLPDFIEPDEVAELVAFLASAGARSITATSIELTAGWK